MSIARRAIATKVGQILHSFLTARTSHQCFYTEHESEFENRSTLVFDGELLSYDLDKVDEHVIQKNGMRVTYHDNAFLVDGVLPSGRAVPLYRHECPKDFVDQLLPFDSEDSIIKIMSGKMPVPSYIHVGSSNRTFAQKCTDSVTSELPHAFLAAVIRADRQQRYYASCS